MSNLESIYKIEVYNDSGDLVADLAGKVRNININLVRNRADTIALTFDLNVIEDFARDGGMSVRTLFNINKYEIRITRGDNEISAGQINYITASADGQDEALEVRAVGWFGLLRDRYTAASDSHTAEDAGAIAWDLINTSQSLTNGDFGITQGTIDASVTRDRTYEYGNVMEKIIQLSEVKNGADFEVTWNRIFNWRYPRLSSKTEPVEFEYPRNIATLSIQEDATGMVNKTIVRGEGFGTEQLVETRSNTPSQVTYKLRERILDYPDVKEATTLQEHGDEELRVASIPILLPQLTLMPNQDDSQPIIKKDFWLDDDFIIRSVESDYFKAVLDNVYRIESISISIDENDIEVITINQGDKQLGGGQDLPVYPEPDEGGGGDDEGFTDLPQFGGQPTIPPGSGFSPPPGIFPPGLMNPPPPGQPRSDI